MNEYEVLRTIYKVGHPISGIVSGYKWHELVDGFHSCQIEIETDLAFKAILPYQNLLDDYDYPVFRQELIPTLGTRLDMVVANYVNGTLYLSAKPSDVSAERIAQFKSFYRYIEGLKVGNVITGRVKKAMPCGIFVDLQSPYPGLIDIGHTDFNLGKKLPYDNSKWPQEDELITCIITYFRLHNMQVGLGWSTD